MLILFVLIEMKRGQSFNHDGQVEAKLQRIRHLGGVLSSLRFSDSPLPR